MLNNHQAMWNYSHCHPISAILCEKKHTSRSVDTDDFIFFSVFQSFRSSDQLPATVADSSVQRTEANHSHLCTCFQLSTVNVLSSNTKNDSSSPQKKKKKKKSMDPQKIVNVHFWSHKFMNFCAQLRLRCFPEMFPPLSVHPILCAESTPNKRFELISCILILLSKSTAHRYKTEPSLFLVGKKAQTFWAKLLEAQHSEHLPGRLRILTRLHSNWLSDNSKVATKNAQETTTPHANLPRLSDTKICTPFWSTRMVRGLHLSPSDICGNPSNSGNSSWNKTHVPKWLSCCWRCIPHRRQTVSQMVAGCQSGLLHKSSGRIPSFYFAYC